MQAGIKTNLKIDQAVVNLKYHLSRAFTWVSVICVSLMLDGNLYEQMVLMRYYDDDLPRTLWFWQDILKSGNFDFYLLAPLSILTTLLAFVFSWKCKKVCWLMIEGFLSLRF